MTKVKLGDIGIFARGKSKHRPRNDERLYSGGGYPLVQTGDIKSSGLYVLDHSQEYNKFGLAQSKLWPEGTLAITIAANIAEASILSYPMCFPDSVVGFTAVKTKTTELFMYYLLAHLRTSIQQSVSDTGSIQDNINLNYLENLAVNIPDLTTQKNIADFLSTIDNKIEFNNKINVELESMAKLIYDYWFVQFDFPDENGKPYKSSGGKMVWNKELKGNIPDGWKVKFLQGLVDFDRGISYTSDDIKSTEGIPMINLACIDTDRNYRPNKLKFFSGRFAASKCISYGDMLIACTDLTQNADIIGSPIIVPNESDKYLYSMDLAKVNIITNDLTDIYLYMTLRTDFYHKYIKYFASGTNVLHLNLDGILWHQTIIPPKELQLKFADIIRSFIQKQSEIINENSKLSELRDWLMPMLMNEQVKIH